jgi:hypothetical protein
MALPFAAVVGGLVTLWLAVTHRDPLVADNYYKEGLAINRVIAQDQAAARVGYQAQLMVSQDRSRVRIQLSGSSDLPPVLRLRFVHPTRAELDRTVELRAVQAGWYEGESDLPVAPRWKVQLEDSGRTWRIGGEWRPAEGSAAMLEARG